MSNSVNKTYELESQYGGSYTVCPKLNMYANNDNLYVGLDCQDPADGFWEPFCAVTVNICELPYLYAAIDTNDNGPKILDFLERNGFGQRTDLSIPSGMCNYPLFQFSAEKLREIDAKTFAEYAKAHGMEKVSLDNQIESAAGKTGAVVSPHEKQPER